MRVALRLQQLARPELEELFRRRPDCLQALLAGERGWERLALALAAPESLASAIRSLNLFLRQVVELTVFTGGALGRAEATREGLETALFEAALLQLTRWGLAFPGEAGEIELVPGVSQLIWDPGGLGPGAEFVLEAMTVDVLRPMAMNMGLAGRALPNRKAELVAAIVARMGNPAWAAATLAKAPPLARATFDGIRGGEARAASGFGAGRLEMDSWRWHPHRAEDGPWWLVGHGLALPNQPGSWRLIIPAEVELAVRGRLFPNWEPDEPEIATTPIVAGGRHPLELVATLSSMLQELRAAPQPALQQGGLPKRVVKRLAANLKQGEEFIHELAVMALEVGLLTEVEVVGERRSRSRRNPRVLQSRQAEIRVSDVAAGWESLSEPERWVDFGRRILLGPGAPGEPGRERLEAASILGFLLKLPRDRGASSAELSAALRWSQPALFPTVTSARRTVLAMGVALSWLGAGGGEPAIGLSAAGRVLAAPARPDSGEMELAFPDPVDTCTVTADHRVVVSGPPSSQLSRFLGRVADVESVQPARVYSLSEASLRRGLDGGLSHQDILDFFQGHCPGGIPQNVAVMIEDVARRHGRVRVGSAGVYVTADDPAEIEALVQGRALRPLGVRRVAPGVAMVDAKSVDQVLGLLRKAGLMPVADREPSGSESPPPGVRMRGGGLRPAPRAAAGSPADGGASLAAEMAESLERCPRVASHLATEHHRGLAPAVLTQAVSGRRPLIIGYRSIGGRVVRVLRMTPFSASSGILQGYEYGMQQIVKLDLERVVWAEQRDATAVVPGLTEIAPHSLWEEQMEEEDSDDYWDDDEDLESGAEILLMPPGRGH